MTIRLGILGVAHGHANNYCSQWRNNNFGINVVCAWDHDAGRLKQFSTKHEIKSVESIDDVLQSVDAVVIASETNLHADYVEKAALNNKAIILQKPLCLDMDEANRIVDVVNKTQIPFTLAWQMRVDPQNIQIKSLIESKAIGKVLRIRRRHGLAAHTWKGFTDSWHVDPKCNRDIWADDVAHAFDFIYWLFGRPNSVTAEIDTLLDQKMPNDNGIALFRFDENIIAEVSASFTCTAGENTCEVIGEHGVIIQNFGDGPSANCPRPPGGIGLKWYRAGDTEWTISDIESPKDHGKRLSNLAKPLADFLHGERNSLCTAEEGRDTLAMVLASYQSSEQGRRIELFP